MSPEVTVVVATFINISVSLAFMWLADIRAVGFHHKKFRRAMLKMIERRLGEDKEYRAAMMKLVDAIEHESERRLPPSDGNES